MGSRPVVASDCVLVQVSNDNQKSRLQEPPVVFLVDKCLARIGKLAKLLSRGLQKTW